MDISCEIIKDLLPIYYDNVCSNDSKILVEKHLAECENCRAELKTISTILPANNIEHNLKEAEAVQNLSKKLKKNMWKSVIKSVIFTLIGVAGLLLILYTFMDFRVM